MGFSLVEAAIVLGVIGAIVGGIWSAANAVSSARKVSATAAGIVRIYQELPTLGVRLQPANVDLTALTLAKGLAPADWASGLPIGGGWSIFFYPLPAARVDFDLSSLPEAECRQLAIALGNSLKGHSASLLVRVADWGAGTWYSNFPINPSSLPATCQQLKLVIPVLQ